MSLPTQYNNRNQDPVGGLSSALARIQSSKPLRELREVAKGVTKQLPEAVQKATAKIDEYARGLISGTGSTLFEELGLYYIGPVDGHNIDDLVAVLKDVKSAETVGPVLIHVVTEKGRGYEPAEVAQDRMHGVVKFDPKTGQQKTTASKTMSYTNYFADSLIAEAEKDNRIIAVHAAMAGGTGLTRWVGEASDLSHICIHRAHGEKEICGSSTEILFLVTPAEIRFEKKFPDRVFDVGIAEQHAVTFAAGLACEGMIPFAAIYSSFIQRGYDQIVHDVCLQKLPVRFAMDRAGMVGADGATHVGAFDVTFMASLPHMVTMAPSNEAELINMVATAVAIDDAPSCFRYPRGNGIGVDLAAHGITKDLKGVPLEIGKGVVRREGKDACLLAYGSSVNEALVAAEMLQKNGVTCTVIDARFCKPLDTALIRRAAKEHPVMISIEEGSIGGFAAHVLQFLSLDGLLDGKLKFRPMCLPDTFIEHGDYRDQLQLAGLTPGQIASTVLTTMGRTKEALQFTGASMSGFSATVREGIA